MKAETKGFNASHMTGILVVLACLVPHLAWGLFPVNEHTRRYDKMAIPSSEPTYSINHFSNKTDDSKPSATLFAEADLETLVNQWNNLTIHQKADVFSKLCSKFLKDRANITNRVNRELNRDGNRLSDHKSSYESFKKGADDTLKRLFERWEQNRDPHLLDQMSKVNENLKTMKDALDVMERWDFQTQIELEDLYHPSLGGRCVQICEDFDATVKDFTSFMIPEQMKDGIMKLVTEGKDCFDYKSSWGRIGGLAERLRNRKEMIEENFHPSLYAGNELLKEAEKILIETKTGIEITIIGPSRIEADKEFALSVKPKDSITAIEALMKDVRYEWTLRENSIGKGDSLKLRLKDSGSYEIKVNAFRDVQGKREVLACATHQINVTAKSTPPIEISLKSYLDEVTIENNTEKDVDIGIREYIDAELIREQAKTLKPSATTSLVPAEWEDQKYLLDRKDYLIPRTDRNGQHTYRIVVEDKQNKVVKERSVVFRVAEKVLNVARVRQEGIEWCWAASSQAVLNYMGKTSIRACDLVNSARRSKLFITSPECWGTEVDCCKEGPTGKCCDFGLRDKIAIMTDTTDILQMEGFNAHVRGRQILCRYTTNCLQENRSL